jgi:signal peptidase II
MKISRLSQLGFLLAIVIIAADQLSKHFVLQYLFEQQAAVRGIEITSFFNLVLVWNRGISFGIFNQPAEYTPYVLIAVATVLVALVTRWLLRAERRADAIGFGLIIGGAIGNVIDRFRYGAVADFLDFHAFGYHYPAFNVADSAIVIGAGIILYLWAVGAKKDI